LEVYTLPLLGHGTPIDSSDLGSAAPYVLEAGISSSRLIAAFWGLAAVARQPARERQAEPQPQIKPEPRLHSEKVHAPQSAAARRQGIILRALKAAGLLGKKLG
jgi:hypothetical protein